MGMYTEIVVKITINKTKIGEQAFSILEALFNPNTDVVIKDITNLPSHEFFNCDRWVQIGNSHSFYHHPNAVADWYYPSYEILNDYTDIHIFNRSDLKNYDNEIEKFFDWINTLNIGYDGDFIGYSLYEEDDTPTIYNRKSIK